MAEVLVVDDDPAVLDLVGTVLEIEGHRVRRVADGPSALRSVAEQRPDLVVLDIMMPGMDGQAVLRQLRSSRGAELPVCMLTALDDDATTWESWRAGCDWYLSKPFEADALLRFVDLVGAEPVASAVTPAVPAA